MTNMISSTTNVLIARGHGRNLLSSRFSSLVLSLISEPVGYGAQLFCNTKLVFFFSRSSIRMFYIKIEENQIEAGLKELCMRIFVTVNSAFKIMHSHAIDFDTVNSA
jgi:hypothetical protein